MAKLALNGLTKRYGAVAAVDGIDLALERGEFVSLLGPSGCGKTTTLRMIAGFVPPDEGTIALDGEALSAPGWALPPERRQMSMIFQSYAIWPNMTVYENVAFGLKLRRMSRDEVRRRVGRILDIVKLGALAERYPSELSGGQQQRVALARAVVVEPAVLLLDEPLSNLDANLREEMRFEIRRLHDALRITTVYVTHDQAEAMATSDRIVVMNQGRIEQIDTPFGLYNRPRTRFVAGFIGRTNLVEAARIGAGAGLVSIRPQDIRLLAQASNGALAATVAQRAYLGEYWDYVVRLGADGISLRVTAPPIAAFEPGASVWVEIDPARIVVLEGDGT